MLPSERLDFSPIDQRPNLALPDGARLAVSVIVNVEEWDPTQPMPRTVLTPPAGGTPMPDIPNWAWHEYGNRVGFWRMLEVLDHFRIRAVLAVNGSAIRRYEPIARAARERGWEFIGHDGVGKRSRLRQHFGALSAELLGEIAAQFVELAVERPNFGEQQREPGNDEGCQHPESQDEHQGSRCSCRPSSTPSVSPFQ